VVRRALLAAALLAGCFTGTALEGEPCIADADCGPALTCADGLCGEFRCRDPEAIALDNLAPDIFLLVDYAATMDKPVGDGDQVRWDLVRAAVERLADELGADANLGLQVVPSVDPEPDSVPDPCYTTPATRLDPAPARGAAVRAALRPSPAKNGEHALGVGLGFALEALAARPGAAMRPQAVVLISDGLFNCNPDEPDLVTRIERFDATLAAQVAAAGVPVYVVGVDPPPHDPDVPAPGPGEEVRLIAREAAIREVALAGGRPRAGDAPYYDVADIAPLIADLRAIPPAFADCRVALSEPPAYPQRLIVSVAGARFKLDDACTDGRGWRWADAANDRIELCPHTCAEFRAARALTIDQRCPIEQ
jgi:hypothetical protein